MGRLIERRLSLIGFLIKWYQNTLKEVLMNKKALIVMSSVAAVMFTTSLALAAPWKGSGGWCMGSEYQRL